MIEKYTIHALTTKGGGNFFVGSFYTSLSTAKYLANHIFYWGIEGKFGLPYRVTIKIGDEELYSKSRGQIE